MVDGGGLENRWTGNGPGGSNPSPSATSTLSFTCHRVSLARRMTVQVWNAGVSSMAGRRKARSSRISFVVTRKLTTLFPVGAC